MVAAMSPLSKTAMKQGREQLGVALIVAMIALVAMTLAGVALVRSVDTNALIAGNLAFRQSATMSADAGIEAARNWLKDNPTGLESDSPSNGYYATKMSTGGLDGKGVDITGSRTAGTADNIRWKDADGTEVAGGFDPACLANNDTAGNRVCYIIHRMCLDNGALADANCNSAFSSGGAGGSAGTLHQSMTYQKTIVGEGTQMGFYRISVRVSGPRNNISYVQAFVQF